LSLFGIWLGCSLTLTALVVFVKKGKNHDPDEKFIFMEMFSDIKDSIIAKLYTTMLLARRTAFVLIIILLNGEVNRSIIYLTLAGTQLFYFLFIVS
jgi:hypothetical protein